MHSHACFRNALALVLLCSASGAFAQSSITLTGTIRDFHSNSSAPGYNPDFQGPAIVDDRGIVTSTLGSDGTPVYNLAAHPNGTATTHVTNGVPAFNQWYHDAPGSNISSQYAITLGQVGTTDTFSYTNNSFFPIDNQSFGNEGLSHNYSFTYQLHTMFGYRGGEMFNFSGDDDVFVYLNNKLAVDLGGVHNTESQTVNLDTIASSFGLTVGNSYNFDLFFAERETPQSTFSITTSLALQPTVTPEPGSVALLVGLTATGAGFLSRRRRRQSRNAA